MGKLDLRTKCPVLDYAEKIVSGKIVAGELVKLACQRHIDDLEHAGARGFYFDRQAAQDAIDFCELMPLTKGAAAAKKQCLKLEAWQKFIIGSVFGWKRMADGFRRFRQVYEEVARKNGKSTKIAAIANYMMVADGEPGAECYATATTKEQAKIVFDEAAAMVKALPRHYAIRRSIKILKKSMTVEKTRSFFLPLSSDSAKLDGLNVHFCSNDEFHAHNDQGKLYGVIDTAMGSRTQPLLWNITTAGSDTNGVCFKIRAYAAKILRGVRQDDTFFAIIFTLDKGDDYRDKKNWLKSNPNLGVSCKEDDIERQLNKAEGNPHDLNNFLTKRLNVWVNAGDAWISPQDWAAAADPDMRLEDFEAEECILGLDLASKKDINALIFLFERDRHFFLFGRYWLPEKAVEKYDEYAAWIRDGWLRVTPGNIVDIEEIQNDILEIPSHYQAKELAYDPHQATQLASNCQKDGMTVVEVRPTVLNFSEPMKELEALLLDGRLHHNGDPVLAWMVSNVVCQLDRKDNIYPRKEHRDNKIDGVVAAIMAMHRWIVLNHDGKASGPSIYEERGMIGA